MEGDQEETSSSPFWAQSSHNHRRRRLSRSSSLVLNSGAFLVVLIVAALAIVFVVVPSLMSFASQIFRPQSVKKSWDSLNLVLVLFAIVCGFLSRGGAGNSNDAVGDDRGVGFSPHESRKSNSSTPRYGYPDRTGGAVFGYGRMRSSSSFPDLRQESSWAAIDRDERWRFHDDMEVNEYGPAESDHHLRHRRRSWRERDEIEEEDRRARGVEAKNIEVDTFEVRTKPEPPPPSPPPRSPSPPPPEIISPPSPPKSTAIKRRPKRNYEAIGQRKEVAESNTRSEVPQPQPPSRPPPPPPPPPPLFPEYQEMELRSGKSEKKRGDVTKEFLISLRRKKKKQRQKSVENFDSLFASIDPPAQPIYPPASPPPPPPPPPPPSVFQTLFSSKKGKSRKSQSGPKSPPPPPPPPPPAMNSSVRVSKNRAQRNPAPLTQRPPMTSDFGSSAIVVETRTIVAGNESPLIPIPPPPPPPPPFRVQTWKFQRRGDFVRMKSDNSSRSASPEAYFGGEESPAGEASPLSSATGMSPARAFCPSPDVDTKADNFIARFRAGLMLEKVNSFRHKSRLGREESF